MKVSIVIVLIVYLSLQNKLRAPYMYDKPFDELKAYENIIKDNQKSLEKSYNEVNDLQHK
jgi:hypothetical protein